MAVECLFCGCTEDQACVEDHGEGPGELRYGCHWVSQEPAVCSSCSRVWAVVQALTAHGKPEGSFQALRDACRAHREGAYSHG